ncbi:MAG TPA: GatB/YqeY domain-containing protein [Candidatus Pacearchaeota archaeon]|nr:GatB/YqeY domain-containing protein [Candidatus Pacearchaeota archaeon]HQM24691.1 GatB/YqeY domain-containing protein [Candidatus Pacearchaeota archaeon]
MLDEIKKDLVSFQKDKNETGVSVLRMLVSSIVNKGKDKRLKIANENQGMSDKELDEKSILSNEEVVEVIASEVKKRRDSIQSFESGGRLDLVEQETRELEILKKYLPKELTEQEIKNIVEAAKVKTGAATLKDIGLIMKEVVPQTKGKADGNLVAKIVKESLI